MVDTAYRNEEGAPVEPHEIRNMPHIVSDEPPRISSQSIGLGELVEEYANLAREALKTASCYLVVSCRYAGNWTAQETERLALRAKTSLSDRRRERPLELLSALAGAAVLGGIALRIWRIHS